MKYTKWLSKLKEVKDALIMGLEALSKPIIVKGTIVPSKESLMRGGLTKAGAEKAIRDILECNAPQKGQPCYGGYCELDSLVFESYERLQEVINERNNYALEQRRDIKEFESPLGPLRTLHDIQEWADLLLEKWEYPSRETFLNQQLDGQLIPGSSQEAVPVYPEDTYERLKAHIATELDKQFQELDAAELRKRDGEKTAKLRLVSGTKVVYWNRKRKWEVTEKEFYVLWLLAVQPNTTVKYSLLHELCEGKKDYVNVYLTRLIRGRAANKTGLRYHFPEIEQLIKTQKKEGLYLKLSPDKINLEGEHPEEIHDLVLMQIRTNRPTVP